MGRKKRNRAKKAAPKKEQATIRVRPDSKTGFYHLDLRRWGEGRPLLRDPHAAPETGAGTRDPETAVKWGDIYAERRQIEDERRQKEEDRREQRRTGNFRRLDLASEKYLDDFDLEVAESTVSASKSALTHLRGWVGDQADPSEITTDHIRAMLKDLKDAEYQHNTLWNLRNRLCVFFDTIGVAPNPARAIKLKEAPSEDVVAWTEEECAAIRAAAREIDAERAPGDKLSRRVLCEYLLCTGARIQEAAAAKWKDFAKKHGVIRVTKQVSRRSNTLRNTKGKKPRSVAVLGEWWDVHNPSGVGLIFTDGSGRPIRYRRLYDVVREILERAGLKKSGQCAHQFRHTYAHIFLAGEPGLPVEVARTQGPRHNTEVLRALHHRRGGQGGVKNHQQGTLKRGPRSSTPALGWGMISPTPFFIDAGRLPNPSAVAFSLGARQFTPP